MSEIVCIFCGKPLDRGKLLHETGECKREVNDAKIFLEKKDRITVGLATCGISAGALETLNELKRYEDDIKISVDDVGCSGMCFNEPVLTVRKNGLYSIYSNLTSDLACDLVDSIKKGTISGALKSRLINPEGEGLGELDYFKKQKRIVMKRCGIISPLNLKQYIALDGFRGLQKALEKTPDEVIEIVKSSNLRGRGGAGFPTGLKWDFLKNARNPETKEYENEKYLIINADEGDPGAFMNRVLMESDPFEVLEGLIIAAYATGTEHGIVYTRAEYPLAVKTMKSAIKILKKNNLLGKNILGIDGASFDVNIIKGAGAFVCGEETSLIKSIEGRRAHPRPRPPYPAEKGLYGKPTNINNVETYAHAANILDMGAEAYKKSGYGKSTGTKCICLTGKIKKSGVVEVELGTTLRTLIYDIGGGIKNNKKFKAAQSGGPSGGCIVESELETPLDYEKMKELGTIMGSGGMVVLDEDDCMVNIAKFFLTFTTDESCGKCVPCREGTKRMLEIITKISKGIAKEEDIEKLKHLAGVVKDTSLCGLGKTAPNPVLSTIEKFRDEYLMHLKGKCPAGKCIELFNYRITDNCVGCGKCKRSCPAHAITGEPKQKHAINALKCIKCGECYKNCAFNAIIKE